MATKTSNPAASAATITTKDTSEKAVVENPSKTLTLTPSDPSTPASDFDSPLLSNPDTPAPDPNPKQTQPPSNDLEKKMRRAERFGVPVNLSENDKRNSRAHRFGTLPGSDDGKSSEDTKRKARADRFGMSEKSSADEEAKKKARLARFGSNVKVDTQEEEKRKARALRFAKDPVSGNGKQNAEMETATAAGNTAGGT